MNKGLLIVISGPSGSGKGTVKEELLKHPNYAFSVSATTRSPRPGETDGVDYYYVTKEEFERRIRDGRMLEYTNYCGNYYGTPLDETKKALEQGKNLILDIETEGAANVKRIFPDAILILLIPPTFRELEERLRGRKTEKEEIVEARLAKAREEIPKFGNYDYVVYNRQGEIKACAEDILAIVRGEGFSAKRHPETADRFFENN